ncbi:MAG TPA: NAD(P)-dependent oxidoreductase, partial [Pirellulales bacterium]|nr:NAD(P)-dependent oxidoreductase [Pirellulales bacterium]
KTLGIIGLGRIGQAIAKRAKAFEMRVLGYDPLLSREKTEELGVEPVASVKEMLPLVDYLTVHTPLNDETRNLIDRGAIELLKPGVRLINCARGGIYNEDALAEALGTGRIAGVALDVFANEPNTDSPLFGMPGVLCTPHLGASTEEAQAQVAVEGVGLLVDFFTTGAVRHAVNMSPLDAKTLESLRGDLDVAHRLGLLLSQFDRAVPRQCVLHYRGEVAAKNTKLLTAAFAAGFLENALAEEINIVNAEVLLRERGIDLIEQRRSDMGAFSSTITAEVITDQATHRAAGTLFGHNMPRLVQLDDHKLEAYMDGVLLIFTHQDVPGIIGRVGTIFGAHKINIAQMAVGRASAGGSATGVLNLDQQPTDAALAEVLSSPDIHTARVIRLPPAGKLPAWLQG